MSKNRKPGQWFGEKVHLDGYVFDSKKEATFYERFVKGSGFNFVVHKGFQLHPIIELFDGKLRLRSSKYTPDFVLYDRNGDIKHVVDVKNSFTSYAIDPAAALRFKLFAQKYGAPVEVVVPRLKSFRVSILGPTKKVNPVTKYDFNYETSDLVDELMSKPKKEK